MCEGVHVCVNYLSPICFDVVLPCYVCVSDCITVYLCSSTGFCSCSKQSIEYLVTRNGRGNAVVLLVGGASEALDARPGSFTLTLKERKGFVRIAVQHG